MAGNDATEVSMSDHSPLVYHLRLVHFFIILATMVVFTVSVQYDQSTVDQAKLEAQELNKWLDKRYWKPHFLGKACNNTVKKHPEFKQATVFDEAFKDGKRKLNLTKTIDGKPHIFQLTINPNVNFKFQCSLTSQEKFVLKDRRYVDQANSLAGAVGFGLSHHSVGLGRQFLPAKVSQVQKMWNKYSHGIDYFRITGWDLSKAILIDRADSKKPLSSVKVLHRGVSVYKQADVAEGTYIARNHFKILRALQPDAAAKLFGYSSTPKDLHMYVYVELRVGSGFGNENKGPKYTLAVPLKSKKYHVDVLKDLVKKLKMDVSTIGNFRDSFPALQSIIDQREKGKVAPAFRNIIEDHVKANETKVEVMGAEIEINSILKVGATVIISLMLYYVLNLRALVYKLRGDNQAYAVAWIGIYPDKTSYLFTLLTVIAMPFAVSIVQLIVTFDIRTLEGQIISGATVFVLCIVSFITLVQSFKLFSKVKRFATRVKN